MAKKKFNMAEIDLTRISMKYAKYTGKTPEEWSKYIRSLEAAGKFTPELYQTLEELSGGRAQEYASGLSMEITNAERKAKQAHYSGESKTDSAEKPKAIVHCGFPEEGNEAVKAQLYADGLLSWRVEDGQI